MEWINNLLSQNIIIVIFTATLAGFVSSFSPCTLSTLPLIIGYMSDNKVEDKKKSKRWLYGVFFSLGIILMFTVIGVLSAIIGKSLRYFSNIWYIILGIILLISALQILGIFGRKDSCKRPKLKKGILGAFFLGILGGFMASPCTTPALVVIVSIISQGQNILLGAILMLFYSIGFCIVIILASISIETITRLSASQKYNKIGKILKIILSLITIMFALYLFYIAF